MSPYRDPNAYRHDSRFSLAIDRVSEGANKLCWYLCCGGWQRRFSFDDALHSLNHNLCACEDLFVQLGDAAGAGNAGDRYIIWSNISTSTKDVELLLDLAYSAYARLFEPHRARAQMELIRKRIVSAYGTINPGTAVARGLELAETDLLHELLRERRLLGQQALEEHEAGNSSSGDDTTFYEPPRYGIYHSFL